MSIIEEICREYKNKDPRESGESLKKLRANMINAEDVFRESLTAESEELFDEYDACRTELEEYSEKKAFERGVSYAVRFIFEALLEK